MAKYAVDYQLPPVTVDGLLVGVPYLIGVHRMYMSRIPYCSHISDYITVYYRLHFASSIDPFAPAIMFNRSTYIIIMQTYTLSR